MTIEVETSYSLSRRGSASEDAPISWLMEKALEVPGLLSLAAGLVDQETLPHTELLELMQGVLGEEQTGRAALQYGTTPGNPDLRQAVIEGLAAAGNAPLWSKVGPDEVLVTTGSQQFLYLLAEVVVEPEDVVLVEDPSYFVYVGALKSLGAQLRGVACDRQGVIPEALDVELETLQANGLLNRVKLIYLMTYYQNPTGASLSASRRQQVWEVFCRWLDKGLNALVAEDAAYRDLRFPGVPDLPPLFELQDENRRVCYTQSFSKILAPGLRLGFGVAPPEVLASMTRLKSHHDFGSSNLCQRLAQRALTTGLFNRHAARLRERYRDKAALLFNVLRDGLGNRIEAAVPEGGLYLWARLPVETGIDSPLFAAAMQEKVIYVPGETCAIPGHAGSRHQRSMRLCYAYPSDSDLLEAAQRLVRAVKRVLPDSDAAASD